MGLVRAVILGLLLGRDAHAHETAPLLYDFPHDAAALPLQEAIPLPAGSTRTEVETGSFAEWMRRLPVRPDHPPIVDWKGEEVLPAVFAYAVFDVDVRRYQECADIAMRLWAEYLWSRSEIKDLRFKLENKAVNPMLSKVRDRTSLDRMLAYQFAYASSNVLKRDLADVQPAEVVPGDVVVMRKPGSSQGHVFVIADVAVGADGRKKVVIAHSNIPAQSLHVVPNPMPYVGWEDYRDEFSDRTGQQPTRCWHDWETMLAYTVHDENGQGVVRRFGRGT